MNEALEEDGTLRKTPWLEAIGEDYLAKAFEFAHEADPDAELYYNDYNLWKPAKRDAAIRLVAGLKAKGLRVDGIGEQAHWGLDDPPLAAIDAALGGDARLRDRRRSSPSWTWTSCRATPTCGARTSRRRRRSARRRTCTRTACPAAVQEKLARRYADVFTLFLKHDVGRVTFWGVTDATSWLDNFPIPGRVNYPLLWDRDGREKPAFEAVAEVLRKHAGQ